MKSFIGLDLSLRNTGVALLKDDKAVDYYSFGLELKKSDGNEAIIKRYIQITHRIVHFIKKNEADLQHIVIENYGFGGPGLAVQCELGGIVKSQIFLSLKRVPLTLPSKVIRKLLFDEKVPKTDNIKGLVKEKLLSLGYPEMSNFDQSDALAIAHVAKKLFSGSNTPYEKKVLAGLLKQNQKG